MASVIEILIDRRLLRRGAPVVRSYIDGVVCGADVPLLAPVLRTEGALACVLDAAAEYCVRKNMDPRWAALLRAFFASEEPCIDPGRPEGVRAWLSPAQVQTVVAGFGPLLALAHGGERRGAYRSSCPDDLVEIWATLYHLWREWLAGVIETQRAAAAKGESLAFALVDSEAEAALAMAEAAERVRCSHRLGGRAPYPLPHCMCGEPFELHLWLDADDPVVALPPAVGAGVPLIFCNACDALWNDPLLAYVVGPKGLDLIARPKCDQRNRRASSAGALPEVPVTVVSRGSLAETRPCPRCAQPAGVLVELTSDQECAPLHPEIQSIAWRLCRACGVVEAEAMPG